MTAEEQLLEDVKTWGILVLFFSLGYFAVILPLFVITYLVEGPTPNVGNTSAQLAAVHGDPFGLHRSAPATAPARFIGPEVSEDDEPGDDLGRRFHAAAEEDGDW